MKAFEDKILSEGIVQPGGILNVSSFFNCCIDTNLIKACGQEILNLYRGVKITKVLTIETSGIPLAFVVGCAFGVPVVYAKKHKSANLSGEMYSAKIHSYTHGNDYTACVAQKFLSETDQVLVVDDFLATGNALFGMIDICSQANCSIAGFAIGIEKGFQGGGDDLRAKGYRVESLAVIDRFSENSIVFRK